MAKFLMWIVVGFLSLLVWKSLSGRSHLLRRNDRDRQESDRTSSPPAAPDESMLRCAHCGVHFPASEGIAGEGGAYCSAAHRDVHRDAHRAH